MSLRFHGAWMVVAIVLASWRVAAAQEANSQTPPDDNQPRAVTVWCLSYSTPPGGASYGKCSPVRITSGGPGGSNVRVGFFESEVGGSGNQWRSAGWSAAITAAQITDFDPRSLQVSFEYEGRVDGPSAGALMTIGVLAAVRGDKVRDDAAMTGTINPDGTIGPVGGIPYKIEGAAKQGKKLVLIPAGIRFESNDQGNNIDLIEHGKSLGVQVRPVVDIYTAYKLMTDADLPRPMPSEEPRPTRKIDGVTVTKMQGWVNRFRAARDDYDGLPRFARNERSEKFMSQGRELLGSTSRLLDEGELAAAYWDTIHATALAHFAMELGRNIHTFGNSGRQAMSNRIRDNGWLRLEIDNVAERLRRETPKTLDQLAMYLSACETFFEAIACQSLAAVQLKKLPANLGEHTDDVVLDAAGRQILGYLDLQLCRDLLDFMAACEGEPIPADAPIIPLARFYQRAGDANVAVFDSLIVEPRAEAAGISLDDQRELLTSNDEQYALLRGSEAVVLPQLSRHFGEGEASKYAYLASGLFVYPRAAGLIAKYYSMRVRTDETGKIVSVPREKTLHDWLDQTEDQARRSIGFLQRQGMDVSLCAQVYQIAHVRRNRGLDEKFEALSELLSAHCHAQALRHLAGLTVADDKP